MPLTGKDTYQLKIKSMETNILYKWKPKWARVTIFVSDRINFKLKTLKRENCDYYIIIKRPIQQEGITIINIYIHWTPEHTNT